MLNAPLMFCRRLPDGTGWILDGFPTTYAQAKLLEKALTGVDTPTPEPSQIHLKPGRRAGKRSQLAPDPNPPPPPPDPKSAIDVVILFDLPDEVALRRSAGRTCELISTHLRIVTQSVTNDVRLGEESKIYYPYGVS